MRKPVRFVIIKKVNIFKIKGAMRGRGVGRVSQIIVPPPIPNVSLPDGEDMKFVVVPFRIILSVARHLFGRPATLTNRCNSSIILSSMKKNSPHAKYCTMISIYDFDSISGGGRQYSDH